VEGGGGALKWEHKHNLRRGGEDLESGDISPGRVSVTPGKDTRQGITQKRERNDEGQSDRDRQEGDSHIRRSLKERRVVGFSKNPYRRASVDQGCVPKSRKRG